jgi:hypothetical protein
MIESLTKLGVLGFLAVAVVMTACFSVVFAIVNGTDTETSKAFAIEHSRGPAQSPGLYRSCSHNKSSGVGIDFSTPTPQGHTTTQYRSFRASLLARYYNALARTLRLQEHKFW